MSVDDILILLCYKKKEVFTNSVYFKQREKR